MMSGTAGWEDRQPEPQKIQILFCQSLTARPKSSISPSVSVLEKGGFESEAHLGPLFSALYWHTPKKEEFNSLINELGLERCQWDCSLNPNPGLFFHCCLASSRHSKGLLPLKSLSPSCHQHDNKIDGELEEEVVTELLSLETVY